MNEKRKNRKVTGVENEDADSGLDNASESSHSSDEDSSTISSDLKDCPDRDGEKMIPPIPFFVHPTGILRTKTMKIDVRIEVNQNDKVVNEYEEVIEFYEALSKSQCETVDFSVTSSVNKPEWFDEEKFKRGQKFARDHLFCINFAEMVSLFILFAQKASLGPLIFTGKSDSPFAAFNRYLSTLTKLMSWYQDDVWSKGESSGKKNLNIVRGMHKNVFQKLNNISEEELAEKTTLGDPATTALWCPLRNVIVEDFRENVSPAVEDFVRHPTCKKVWINQADMSITQFGFVGLAVTFPQAFGIHLASDDDLDAFIHMWRGLGYLLGIKDEYNYCNCDLKTVRKRTRFFVDTIAKPAFREVTCDWEHMCRCLTSGISNYLPQVNFESSFLYLCYVLNVDTPRLRKSVSFRAYFIFQLHRFVFYLMKFRGVLPWLNARLFEVIKKAQNPPAELRDKWQNKEYNYMKQPGKCPIRGMFTDQAL